MVPSSLNNWMDYYFLIEKEYQLVFNRISIGRIVATQLLSERHLSRLHKTYLHSSFLGKAVRRLIVTAHCLQVH
jgi:hypothetical protein